MNEIHGLYANIKMLEQGDLFRHFLCELSEQRQQKIQGMRTEAAKRQSLGAWTLFDRLLVEHAGVHEKDLTIAIGAHCKPYIVGQTDIQFNLSHSGDYVLAVLAPVEIGCDIQRVEKTGREEQLAARFFTPHEQAAYAAGMSFYQLWARKESWIKCDGTGMSQDLRDFSVVADGQCRSRIAGRHFADLRLDGYEIAVCYAGAEEYLVRIEPAVLGKTKRDTAGQSEQPDRDTIATVAGQHIFKIISQTPMAE